MKRHSSYSFLLALILGATLAVALSVWATSIGTNINVTGTIAVSATTGTSTIANGLTIATSGGNVGIGTTSPGQLLHISQTTPEFGRTALLVENPANLVWTNATVMLKTGQSSDVWQMMGRRGDFFIGIADVADYLVIKSSGNVGIGTTTPASLLSVQGNSLTSGTSTVGNLNATSTLSVGGTTGSSLIVLGSGNVGIGTTSPSALYLLSVATSTATSTIQIGTEQSTTKGSCIQLYSPTGAAFRIYATTTGPLIAESGSCR